MFLGIVLLSIGTCLVVYGSITGSVKLYLILIVPVLVMNGPIGLLAILTIFAGMGVLFVGLAFRSFEFALGSLGDLKLEGVEISGLGMPDMEKGGFGGVVFLGPIPIVFGNNKGIRNSMMKVGIFIGAVLLILFVIQVGFLVVSLLL